MARPTKANADKPSKPNRVKIDSDYLIPVRSNVGGVLYYKSKRTGYEETWDETGTVIEMEFSELIAMRNNQKKFFVTPLAPSPTRSAYTTAVMVSES